MGAVVLERLRAGRAWPGPVQDQAGRVCPDHEAVGPADDRDRHLLRRVSGLVPRGPALYYWLVQGCAFSRS